MCGFAIVYSLAGAPIDRVRVRRMTGLLAHRGPDDEGYLLGAVRAGRVVCAAGAATATDAGLPRLEEVEGDFDLAIGARRLVIRGGLAGRQPLAAAGGRTWVVYNGELYAEPSPRGRPGPSGRFDDGSSDTQALASALVCGGTAALAGLNGMWSFAAWDAGRRRLLCGRDALGIKPLYYMRNAAELLIASEPKAILAGLGRMPSPNVPIAVDYLASRVSDHTGETFFEGLAQVPPGHVLIAEDGRVTVARWHVEEEATGGRPGDPPARAFHDALEAAVRDHLVADVRVGATLSGGLDSSSIVVTAAARRRAPLDVFTAVFDEPEIDERRYAAAVAEAAGARSHLVPIDAGDLVASVERMLWHQDEPVISTSVLAQWLVMRAAAAAGVRVLLDGQGADEWLGGYPAVRGPLLADCVAGGDWRAASRVLGAARGWPSRVALAGAALAAAAPSQGTSLLKRAVRRDVEGLHPDLAGYWRPVPHAAAVFRGPDRHVAAALDTLVRTTSLPALLRFLDRNGMAFSIEPRVPFLDARVVAASRALSNADRFGGGASKWVLRDPAWSKLPDAVRLRADKNGFATPEAAWLGGPLRTWALDLLAPDRVRRHGWLDPDAVERARHRLARGLPPPPALWRWVNIEHWTGACERGTLGAAA